MSEPNEEIADLWPFSANHTHTERKMAKQTKVKITWNGQGGELDSCTVTVEPDNDYAVCLALIKLDRARARSLLGSYMNRAWRRSKEGREAAKDAESKRRMMIDTPSAQSFPDTLRSNAAFLRSCYDKLFQAEAEVVAGKLDEAAKEIERLRSTANAAVLLKHFYWTSAPEVPSWAKRHADWPERHPLPSGGSDKGRLWRQIPDDPIEPRNAVVESRAAEAKDAARYRWLRTCDIDLSEILPHELDAALDKAIAAAEEKPA